jgi:hypothetical protein
MRAGIGAGLGGRTASREWRPAQATGGVLYLTSRCAAGSPCTENYRLTVPAHTAVVLDQTSGHVVVSGLDAALRRPNKRYIAAHLLGPITRKEQDSEDNVT